MKTKIERVCVFECSGNFEVQIYYKSKIARRLFNVSSIEHELPKTVLAFMEDADSFETLNMVLYTLPTESTP